MALDIQSIERRSYLRTATGTSKVDAGDSMPAWHIRLTSRQGLVGRGDIAPWPGFSASAEDVDVQLSQIEKRWTGSVLEAWADLESWVSGLSRLPCIRYGLELALMDLWAQHTQCTRASLLNPGVPGTVHVHRLIRTPADAEHAVSRGHRGLKVKLSGRPEMDRAFCEALRKAAPRIPIRFDLNGAWSVETAREELAFLQGFGPCIVEQPIKAENLDGLARLISDCDIPIAADESVVLDPTGTLDIPGIAQVVLKPMFLGGLMATGQYLETARERGIGVCVTHAMESNVGRLGALLFAAAHRIEGVHGLSLIDDERPEYILDKTLGMGVAA